MINAQTRPIGRIKSTFAFCALAAFLPLMSSCDQIGPIGGLIARAIPRHVDAAYKGLANQTVIVMVYMDRGLRMDHPELQLDIAGGLQNKLITIAHDQKPDLLKGTEFPVLARSVIAYQQDHPEIMNEPITTTAARFDGTRLIYLEIKDFSTHSGAPELFKGSITGDLKVIEMKKTGRNADGSNIITATMVYHEEDIGAIDDKQTPKDGMPIGTEGTITEKTVGNFVDEVAKRFYPHDEDRD